MEPLYSCQLASACKAKAKTHQYSNKCGLLRWDQHKQHVLQTDGQGTPGQGIVSLLIIVDFQVPDVRLVFIHRLGLAGPLWNFMPHQPVDDDDMG